MNFKQRLAQLKLDVTLKKLSDVELRYIIETSNHILEKRKKKGIKVVK